MSAARLGVGSIILLGVLAALAPEAAAQPPALQPRVETRLEWAQLQPPPNERLVNLPEEGTASVPLRVGGKIFVSGGHVVCLPDSAYRFSIDLASPPPPWGRAKLDPESARTVTLRIPSGLHQGGWPGPAPNQWNWQDGPTFVIAWDLPSAPANTTYEYRLSGTGEAQLVSGGCHPDPLRQPARHIAETINVTRPYVPPRPNSPEPAGCAANPQLPGCETIAPAQAEASPGTGLLWIATALAVAGLALRRRGA